MNNNILLEYLKSKDTVNQLLRQTQQSQTKLLKQSKKQLIVIPELVKKYGCRQQNPIKPPLLIQSLFTKKQQTKSSQERIRHKLLTPPIYRFTNTATPSYQELTERIHSKAPQSKPPTRQKSLIRPVLQDMPSPLNIQSEHIIRFTRSPPQSCQSRSSIQTYVRPSFRALAHKVDTTEQQVNNATEWDIGRWVTNDDEF